MKMSERVEDKSPRIFTSTLDVVSGQLQPLATLSPKKALLLGLSIV
jgi:hypothetical protein